MVSAKSWSGLFAGAVFLAATLACGASDPDAAGSGAHEVRRAAPQFALPDLAGNTVSLEALRGKIVVIDFWATWCPPCIFQIPILNTLYEARKDAGVVVLGVSVDTEGRDVVAPYAEENEILYPVLLGDESLARQFGAPGFPALVIVAPDGTIDTVHVGLIELAELEAALDRVAASEIVLPEEV